VPRGCDLRRSLPGTRLASVGASTARQSLPYALTRHSAEHRRLFVKWCACYAADGLPDHSKKCSEQRLALRSPELLRLFTAPRRYGWWLTSAWPSASTTQASLLCSRFPVRQNGQRAFGS